MRKIYFVLFFMLLVSLSVFSDNSGSKEESKPEAVSPKIINNTYFKS